MEARSAEEIPRGPEWQYEPKWDGFRCLVVRDLDDVAMWSKSGEDLTRYFPEIAGAVLDMKPNRFILDGEIVVPIEGAFSFDDLLQRIHPAASRVKTLAAKTPGLYLAFDLLKDGKKDVAARPLSERRPSYDHFTGGRFRHGTSILRWRPDKRPAQCTKDQVEQKLDRRLVRDVLAHAQGGRQQRNGLS